MDNKEAMYYSGLELIKASDEGISTKRLKQAIKELELVVFTRENIPF